jgi:DNA-binding CsgD family transcriptional regulator
MERVMNEYRPALAFSDFVTHPPVMFGPRPDPVEPDFMAFLNRLNCGAAILQQNGKVIAINACALENIGEDLLLVHERLILASRAHQEQLEQLLCHAFKRSLDHFECMSLPRQSGKLPFLLQVAPLVHEASLHAIEAPATSALVLIYDLDGRQRPFCSPALRALGLTPAEAAVGSLVGAGFSPIDAADRLGITVLTVRTHLKAIFQKLGLQRQCDLVHIVSRLSMVS